MIEKGGTKSQEEPGMKRPIDLSRKSTNNISLLEKLHIYIPKLILKFAYDIFFEHGRFVVQGHDRCYLFVIKDFPNQRKCQIQTARKITLQYIKLN